MLKLGNKSISDLFIGQKAATKAFLGQKLVWQKATGLPYDAEVEYLESTGTQYINTGYTGGSTTKVEILASSSNTSSYGSIFGARTLQDSYIRSFSIWQRVNSAYARFDYVENSANAQYSNAAWDATGINTIIKDGPTNTLNGIEGRNNNAATFTCEYPFYLFGINTNGLPTYIFNGRIYSCKIWDNNTLVRDFVPVRVGDVGYMYDRASGQLFGNQGTDDFIVGPDVVEVEYLESTGT